MNKLLFLLIALMPQTAFAQASDATVQTPLGGVATFNDLLSLSWSYGSQVILALSVLAVIVGAFLYLASGGSEDRVAQGKDLLTGAFGAVLLVMLSGTLLRLLREPAEGTAGTLADVPTVINNASNILLGFIGAFATAMLLYGAYLYTTAAGDRDKLMQARNAFRYGVYGLSIGVLAFMLVNGLVGVLQ